MSTKPAGQGGHDSPWPPMVVGDPAPVDLQVPVSWPEADKELAWQWIAVQRDTRTCLATRGYDYGIYPAWGEYGDDGALLGEPDPPADWASLFRKPFGEMKSAEVCFNRALQKIGRQPEGSTEFPPPLPRFEADDFDDPVTLDIPPEWSESDRDYARRGWEAELLTRECMAAAGYPQYSTAPYWKATRDSASRDAWPHSLPLDQQQAAAQALWGDQQNLDGDWTTAGCFGSGAHALGLQ